MVRVSYEQKPYRKLMMQTWGADCVASPSTDTESGKSILSKYPDSPGSLGIAISEAVEDAAKHDDTHYSLGSVLNHVLLHQTIIGLETKEQLKLAEIEPDVIVGCVGGGSNFGGIALPFIKDKIQNKNATEFIAVEPDSCPSLTKGSLAYDFGDMSELTPLLKMYTLGHGFIPPSIHAGGLRYHGMAPIISALYEQHLILARAVAQLSCFKAAVDFARTEGFIIAPETSHAVRVVIDEAIRCRQTGQEKSIVFNCSGHGHFDMAAYEQYFAGNLRDVAITDEMVKNAAASLPNI